MDENWQSQFRRRLERFGGKAPDGFMAVSVKIKATTGCFHREHSPHAYWILGDFLANFDKPNLQFEIEEHESGPEILVFLVATTAGLTFAKSVIDLITAVINARSEGIKRGDKRSGPVELIIRGYSKNGEYFEEKILRIPHDEPINSKLIRDVLKPNPKTKKKNTKMSLKHKKLHS
jgi:hypothetical protein